MRTPLVSLLVAVATVSTGFAQAPDSVSFQGYLTDDLGNPINQAGLSMTFKLYDDGMEVWSETQAVDVDNGVYNVLLGTVSALDTMAFNRPFHLGISVGGDSEMSPRTPLAAAAFAKALPGLYTAFAEANSSKSYNVVGGAENNVLGADVTGATIGGGGGIQGPQPVPNSVLANYSTVGGGSANTVDGNMSTVGGGQFNTASGFGSTVAGGFTNTASNGYSTVAGGQSNMAAGSGTVGGGESNVATGYVATIGGGDTNKATGSRATVPGGLRNVAAGYASFAAGQRAGALHDGAFVWQDHTAGPSDTLKSTTENQFFARASGGFKFFTSSAPDTTVRAELAPGSGAWANTSSSASKTAIRKVDTRDYLKRLAAIDVNEWSYRSENGITHVGPMAEDFYAAFGHGPSEQSITTVDADGVALAAIQGLYELVKEQQAEITRMRLAMKRAGIE